MDSRPWDYQAEECSLRSAVDRFNHRRYQRELPNVQQSQQGMAQSQEKANNGPENQVFGQEVKCNMNFKACHVRIYSLGVIQQLRRQEGVGSWSVKCVRGVDRYSVYVSKMSSFVHKG